MKLRVTLTRPGAEQEHHILITADTTATSRDVAAAVAGALGEDAGHHDLTLRVADPIHGTARSLEPGVSLVDSGLTSGSTVELGYAADRGGVDRGPAAAILRVLEGPDAGADFELSAGSSLLGRDASCDVRLTDPRVSKQHARISVGEKIEVIDNNSANGVLIGGEKQHRVTVAPGDQVQVGDSVISIVHLRGDAAPTSTDISFVRSPRVLARPEQQEVELPEPPGPARRPRFPWLALVAPLVMGGVMYLVTRSVLSILFVALSPVLMVGTWITSRLEIRAAQRADVANFKANLSAAQERIDGLREQEVADLLRLYPSVSECVSAITQLNDLVWSRRPEHPEFCQIRLGLGERSSSLIPQGRYDKGLPELVAQVRALADEAVWVQDAPIVADLRQVGSLGVCGSPDVVAGVARGLVVELAGLHSPAEVVICCLTSASRKQRWTWLEWLPHCSSAHSPLSSPQLAANMADGRGLLDELSELVEERMADSSTPAKPRGPLDSKDEVAPPRIPTVVVICDDPQVDRARLTQVAESGPDAGVHLIWVADRKNDLPAACRTYLDLGDGHGTLAGQVRIGTTVQPIVCETVDEDTAQQIGRRFAPLVDAGAPVEDDSDLPRAISMVALLGADESDNAEAVLERWRQNRSLIARGKPAQPLDHPADLRAMVGHAGSGPMVLDLRRDGPHALVGGTTGAGKSEFLQAWVLGLAHGLSPDRVTFLFVDYKGGAAFAKCVDLPHCVGIVTDLDTYLVRRVLTSLGAELRTREHLLQRKGVKDLVTLEVSGDPECPPSLVIVVDEFAALAGEIPEFVDGMVNIAQRGRSLGLHLVLATQRPAGVIKDNLRANTNLRIALRMADEQDSSDVLGTPMAAHFAAEIPGRGAAKTGPGRITTFQSAFPGARTPHENPVPPIEIVELGFGSGTAWKVPRASAPGDAVATDLDRLVGTISRAATLGEVPEPRKPWLAALAPIYNLTMLSQRRDTEIVLGVRDNPEDQEQVPEYFRPDVDGNIMFIGSGGSGKTTALRTLAVASAITPRSGPVHVYGLDFAGGSLQSLAPMPNVGSIISGDDDERVRRTLRLLLGMIESRSARFNEINASTLGEYRTGAGAPHEPRILLLLDGFSGFRDLYETASMVNNPYAMFSRIAAEGRAVGVHVAVTADRPAAVPMSISAAFPRRIIMRQADEDAYAMLGLPKDVLGPLSPPGRAMPAESGQELQIAIVGDDTSAAAQAATIVTLARQLAPNHPHRPAPIAALSSLIAPDEVPANVKQRPVLGVADLDLQPMGFEPSSMVLVSGPTQSGKTTAVLWMAQALKRAACDFPLYHLSPRRSPLAGLALWEDSAVGDDALTVLIDKIAPLAAAQAEDGAKIGLFIESLPELVSSRAENSLAEVLKSCRRNGHFVVAEGELASWGSSWPLIAEVRNERTGLLLQPEQMDGDTVLRTGLPRGNRADFPAGRGYWVKGGVAIKVQVPLPQ